MKSPLDRPGPVRTVESDTNMAGERLLIQEEIHENLAAFIFVREGEGSLVVGGKLTGGQQSAADEIRGTPLREELATPSWLETRSTSRRIRRTSFLLRKESTG